MMRNGLDVAQPCDTVRLDFDVVDRSRTRCRTTNVEGTHGQLCTRLTDRLRRDNTDSLTDVNADLPRARSRP